MLGVVLVVKNNVGECSDAEGFKVSNIPYFTWLLHFYKLTSMIGWSSFEQVC